MSHFKIVEKIGEGGMGEVYRAVDTKLDREVAIKVLPDAVAADPERLARFEREARVLASLNHSNIAGLYELAEADGKLLLVMEMAEGETLAERIRRGRLPLDEALAIALEVARALEAAHERGIVHRDLKPANVKVGAAGVKVLDFGLAKALAEEGAEGAAALEHSPTLTQHMTEAGILMGTAAYMSPEQARGEPADRRADVWAFGIVLMEMLTGKGVYSAPTVSDTLAGVLAREPEWSELPPDTPEGVRDLLERCLEKDPKERLQAIGEARIALERRRRRQQAPKRAAAQEAAVTPVPAWRRALPWLLAVAAAAVAVVALLAGGDTPRAPQMQLEASVSEDRLFADLGSSVVLSPDGRNLAFVTGDTGDSQLYVRPLGSLRSSRVTSGTAGSNPYHPFFSPDGQWLGFVTSTELKKVQISGGTAVTLARLDRSRGAAWSEDGTIVYAPSPASGLMRIAAAGGEAQSLTELDRERGEATHRWPEFLPGGRTVIFTSHTSSVGNFSDASIEALDLASGDRRVLHRGGFYARYLHSGHLAWVNDGTLYVAAFDPDGVELLGEPLPVLQGLATSTSEGAGQFSVARDGLLAYVSGDAGLPRYPIVRVDRDGRSRPLWQEAATYAHPRLSPDGSKLAVSVLREDNVDVWVYDLQREVATRLTFDENYDADQVWSPDGEFLVFTSSRDGVGNVYRKRADGSGELERLTGESSSFWASSWSSDGRYLAGVAVDNGLDIFTLALDGGDSARLEPFETSPFAELDANFSPNGRWLAYTSNESGRYEVYVRTFPAGQGKWQISDGGGGDPRWSRDGTELFFRSDEGIMVAEVETGGRSFRAGKPRLIFAGDFRGGSSGLAIGGYSFGSYDVAPDAESFVMFPRLDQAREAGHVTLVTEWFEEVRRLSQPR